MKTYSKKSNAQRAAKSSLGVDAKDGVDFTLSQNDGAWVWIPIVAAESVKPPAAKPPTLPAAPDFSAKSHKAWLKLHAKVVALAVAGDVDGLAAIKIPDYSSSPKALNRYRAAALVSLKGA